MYMTIKKIDELYDGQWVYIINIQEGENGEVIGGEVVAHNENREKVICAMLEHPDNSVYIKYAGIMPENRWCILYSDGVIPMYALKLRVNPS